MVAHYHRFDIVLAALDPTVGAEVQKTRPCIIVTPDEMNDSLQTLILAPVTSTLRRYPMRVPIRFQRRNGMVMLDQLRAVDKSRIVRGLGKAREDVARTVSATLVEMFAYGN